MIALIWLGLLFNLAGVALAALALISNRHKHSGRPLLPWWGPFSVWVSVNVLRRPRPTATVTAEAAIAWAVGMNAEAIVIPAADAPVERQIEYLREQVGRLRGKIKEEAKARQEHVSKAYDKLSAADAALADRVGVLDERTVDQAAGSTWLELWGLICVAIGSALMALPPLLGWS